MASRQVGRRLTSRDGFSVREVADSETLAVVEADLLALNH
jgi:hypothetical protein